MPPYTMKENAMWGFGTQIIRIAGIVNPKHHSLYIIGKMYFWKYSEKLARKNHSLYIQVYFIYNKMPA